MCSVSYLLFQNFTQVKIMLRSLGLRHRLAWQTCIAVSKAHTSDNLVSRTKLYSVIIQKFIIWKYNQFKTVKISVNIITKSMPHIKLLVGTHIRIPPAMVSVPHNCDAIHKQLLQPFERPWTYWHFNYLHARLQFPWHVNNHQINSCSWGSQSFSIAIMKYRQ